MTQVESRTSRSRLISNSVASVGAYALTLPIGFAVVRFTEHRLGLYAFGIWTGLVTIASWAVVLDLGVSVSLLRFVPGQLARGERDALSALLSTAFVLYAAVGAIFAAVLFAAEPWVLGHVVHASGAEAGRMYAAAVVAATVYLPFGVLTSAILGVQRADVVAGINLLQQVLLAVGTVAVLEAGLGISGLVLTFCVASAATIAITWLSAARLLPSARIDPRRFELGWVRRVYGFSARVLATSVSLVLNDQVDRFLLAYALGPASLAYYGLASLPARALRGVSFSLVTGVLSAAADLEAADDLPRLRALCLRGSRYLAIADLGLCAGLGGLALPLVALWLGAGFDRVAITLAIILAGYAIWLPTQAVSDIVTGVGHPEVRMRADIAFLALHTPLSVLLLWRFGYFGTVIGTSSALAVTRVYVVMAGARYLGLSATDLLRDSFAQPLIAALLALAAVVGAQMISLSQGPPIVLLELALFAAIYLFYVYRWALDPYDRALVRVQLSVLTRRLRGVPATPGG